jgi:hypothetical protein
MQMQSTDIDQTARRGELAIVRSRTGSLVKEPGRNEKRKNRKDDKQDFQTRDSTAIEPVDVEGARTSPGALRP